MKTHEGFTQELYVALTLSKKMGISAWSHKYTQSNSKLEQEEEICRKRETQRDDVLLENLIEGFFFSLQNFEFKKSQKKKSVFILLCTGVKGQKLKPSHLY